jgi:hypothetical protein
LSSAQGGASAAAGSASSPGSGGLAGRRSARGVAPARQISATSPAVAAAQALGTSASGHATRAGASASRDASAPPLATRCHAQLGAPACAAGAAGVGAGGGWCAVAGPSPASSSAARFEPATGGGSAHSGSSHRCASAVSASACGAPDGAAAASTSGAAGSDHAASPRQAPPASTRAHATLRADAVRGAPSEATHAPPVPSGTTARDMAAKAAQRAIRNAPKTQLLARSACRTPAGCAFQARYAPRRATQLWQVGRRTASVHKLLRSAPRWRRPHGRRQLPPLRRHGRRCGCCRAPGEPAVPCRPV